MQAILIMRMLLWHLCTNPLTPQMQIPHHFPKLTFCSHGTTCSNSMNPLCRPWRKAVLFVASMCYNEHISPSYVFDTFMEPAFWFVDNYMRYFGPVCVCNIDAEHSYETAERMTLADFHCIPVNNAHGSRLHRIYCCCTLRDRRAQINGRNYLLPHNWALYARQHLISLHYGLAHWTWFSTQGTRFE